MKRLLSALKAFWHILCGREEAPPVPVQPESVKPATAPATPAAAITAASKSASSDKHTFQHGAIYALVLLQRHGRLIDFLQEKLDDYSDEQIGTAVRQIHHDCQVVFTENFHLQRILPEEEGQPIKFEKAVDPLAIKLTGAIPAAPPYQGVLRHKGWKIGKIHLPERSGKIDPHIIAAAEVEIA